MENGHFAFLHPPWCIAAMYAVHFRLIGKLLVDFLLVIIKLFLLGATAEALRANVVLEVAVFEGVGQAQNFR